MNETQEATEEANGSILMLIKNKWGLYRIVRYKPRVNTNL